MRHLQTISRPRIIHAVVQQGFFLTFLQGALQLLVKRLEEKKTEKNMDS